MTNEDQNRIKDIVAGIPELRGISSPPERLGGLTNKVFRVGGYVLRIPGEGTSEYINRGHEAASALIAATAGVSPAVVHVDAVSGVMVTQLVAEAATMTPHLFKSREGAVGRAGKALRKLHDCGQEFPFRFELFAMIDDYLKILSTKDVSLPAGYHDVVREASVIRAALAQKPAPLVPCHCDPLCENFLDDGNRMMIVDWEYCGMNDPMWDLGDLSVEGEFSPSQDAALLQAYFDGEPKAADVGRMVAYKAMCDLLWTLWGLIQLANKNPADNFEAYANNRFARCKKLMGSAEYSLHVKNII